MEVKIPDTNCKWSKPDKVVIDRNEGDHDVAILGSSPRRSIRPERSSEKSTYRVVEYTWMTVKMNRERQNMISSSE